MTAEQSTSTRVVRYQRSKRLATLALVSLGTLGCRSPTAAAVSEPAAVASPLPIPHATPATAHTGRPPTDASDVRASTAKMDDDASVFGLAAYGGRWVVGTAFTDERDTIAVRPVLDRELGPAVHTVQQRDAMSFPTALVGDRSPARAPWVVT